MKQIVKDGLMWGFGLWLVGYILSFILFFVVPQNMIGWIIAPIGTAMTVWVLLKKIKSKRIKYLAMIALIWTVLAVLLDYVFIVILLKPVGYYKPSVYMYYGLTFALPLFVGYKNHNDMVKRE